MPKQTKQTKNGRPPKVEGTNKYEFDEEKIGLLASKFWSTSEIAAFYDVDEGTIRKRFPNLIVKGREKGKARLRDMQLAAARKGNVVMLIWLGKQYLGQIDPDKQLYAEQPEKMPEFDSMSEKELDEYIDSRR
ncbi:MAG: hypothetical protein IPJ03_16665 [Ignavibacteriales bacterium]|nr:hypothetical protein [Ignavibacteriales bacterium]